MSASDEREIHAVARCVGLDPEVEQAIVDYLNNPERNIYSLWIGPLDSSFRFTHKQVHLLHDLVEELRRALYVEIVARYCTGQPELLYAGLPPELAKLWCDRLTNEYSLPASIRPELPEGELPEPYFSVNEVAARVERNSETKSLVDPKSFEPLGEGDRLTEPQLDVVRHVAKESWRIGHNPDDIRY